MMRVVGTLSRVRESVCFFAQQSIVCTCTSQARLRCRCLETVKPRYHGFVCQVSTCSSTTSTWCFVLNVLLFYARYCRLGAAASDEHRRHFIFLRYSKSPLVSCLGFRIPSPICASWWTVGWLDFSWRDDGDFKIGKKKKTRVLKNWSFWVEFSKVDGYFREILVRVDQLLVVIFTRAIFRRFWVSEASSLKIV